MLKKFFQPHVTIYRYDKFLVGFVPAMIAPWIGVLLFYLAKFSDMSLRDYFIMIFKPQIFSPIMSLGVVLNLFIFFLFISRNYYIAARAVIFASILYAIPIVWVKFFH
ncbi:MAG: hypothetical protein RMJ53_00285 [Chitinophagales bacterium]|nr:hypothetical protein [Chitinophagales bacterium]